MLVQIDSLRVSQIVDDKHLISLWLNGKSQHSQEAYTRDVEQFVGFVELSLNDVKLQHFCDWADHLKEKGSKPATQARKLSAVKSLFSFGHRIGYLRNNVGAEVKLPGIPDKMRERILSEEDIAAIVNQAHTVRNRTLLNLFFVSGARVSELSCVCWGALIARGNQQGKISLTGRGNKVRTVLLPASVWKGLMELKSETKFNEPNQPVFRSRKGGPLSRQQIWRIVRDAAKAAGFNENVSPDWLRHAHASHTFDHEAPVNLIRGSIGHQSLQTTSRNTHTRPEDSSSEHRGLMNILNYQPDYEQQSAINPDDIWVPQGKMITVAGRKIGGMVYLGSRGDQDWETYGDAVIDMSLPVARYESDIEGNTMSYWPSYSTIHPVARAAYLDWLAGNRSDKQYGLGYIFLYFYGLERRFFLDSPSEAEKKTLIAEVKRLLAVYGSSSHSIRKYMSVFLSVASTIMNPNQLVEPRFGLNEYRIPLEIRIAIGRMLREGQPLSYDWSLCWYAKHPSTRFRTAATRAFPEFRELFRQMFEQNFPAGLKLPPPSNSLSVRYNAAAGTFSVDLTHFFENVPDIKGIFGSLREVRNIVEQATESLDKYSRFLGRDMNGRNTIEAYTLLPASLRPLFPNSAIREFRSWAEDVMKSNNLVKIEKIIEKLTGKLPEKIYERHLTKARDILACFSIGLEPDPHFSFRVPRLGEPVVLFDLPEIAPAMSEISEEYRNVLLCIMIGGFIAHADDSVAEKEKSVLETIVNSTSVSEIEQIRLLANLRWVLAVPPNLKWLKSCLKNTSEDLRHDMGRIALSIAAVDGVIQPKEIRAIEGLYEVIGLESESIYADLHTLVDSDEPKTILLPREKEKEFTIPQQEKGQTIVLDVDRINALISDTAQVSALLSDIFNEQDLLEEISQDTSGSDNIFDGLDSDHVALLHELLRKESWNKSEYTAVVSQHKLMPEGAIETLNEWSFDHFEDILIDEDECYELNTEIVIQLRG